MHLHGGEIVASPAWAKAHQLSERLTGTPPPAGRMLENIVTAEARLTIPKGDPARTVTKHLAKACQRDTLSALVPKIAPVLALTGGGGRSARPLAMGLFVALGTGLRCTYIHQHGIDAVANAMPHTMRMRQTPPRVKSACRMRRDADVRQSKTRWPSSP